MLTTATPTMVPFSFCKDVSIALMFRLDVYRTGMSLEVHANPFPALGYPLSKKPFLSFKLVAIIKGHLTHTHLERTRGRQALLSIREKLWAA